MSIAPSWGESTRWAMPCFSRASSAETTAKAPVMFAQQILLDWEKEGEERSVGDLHMTPDMVSELALVPTRTGRWEGPPACETATPDTAWQIVSYDPRSFCAQRRIVRGEKSRSTDAPR